MDLQTKTESYGVGDFRWLRSSANLSHGLPCTIPTADLVEAFNFADGALKGGTLLAKYTSGVNDGFYGAYCHDASDGRQTAVGVLLEDIPVRKDADGAVTAPRIVGTVLLLDTLVDLAFMPATANAAGNAAHTIVAGDLPSNLKAV